VSYTPPGLPLFSWISDLHIDSTNYNSERFTYIFSEIKNSIGNFVVATGDIADGAAAGSYTKYLNFTSTLSVPVYTIPGNHDSNYVNYDAAGLTRRFYIESEGISFIGIDTQGVGSISAAELNLLESNLILAGTKPKVVLAHHPVLSDDFVIGKAELLALLSTYNVKAYLSGHRHTTGLVVNAGTSHIDGAGLINSSFTAFMRVYKSGSSLFFQPFNANYPFGNIGGYFTVLL
jgi:3',5'-cyclic-AMP phosphodiesterase